MIKAEKKVCKNINQNAGKLGKRIYRGSHTASYSICSEKKYGTAIIKQFDHYKHNTTAIYNSVGNAQRLSKHNYSLLREKDLVIASLAVLKPTTICVM